MLLVPVNQQTVFAFSGGALGPASWIHTVEPAALLVFWDLGGTWTENGPPGMGGSHSWVGHRLSWRLAFLSVSWIPRGERVQRLCPGPL